MSMDLLLLDDKDNLIKASINHRLVGKFHHMLQEGSIIHIKKFDLGKSNDRFKLTDHKNTIYFTQLKSVIEVLVDALVIAINKFRIQSYENLLSMANTNEELPDVIGKIICQKVKLSVWDGIASDFRAFLCANNMKKRIVVIPEINPKLYSGELYLNTSSATRFYMNEDLHEVKKYLSMQKGENSQNSPLDESELEPVDFLLTTISQMLSFLDDEDPQEKAFYCKATIAGIETRNGWNYISCGKCFRKLMKEGNTLKFPKCFDNVIEIVRSGG